MQDTYEEVKRRIEKLRKLIDYHRTLYHTFDAPEISDSALDALKNELQKLEFKYPNLVASDSPTQKVGGTPLEKFEKVKHEIPMYSLNDAFSEKDIEEWFERVKNYLAGRDIKLSKTSFYCEPKIDGLAIELVYDNGNLVCGATRGDGKIGEDVTQNLAVIKDIPKKLEALGKWKVPSHLIVRGEIFITKKELLKINEEKIRKGEKPYANVRNLAAGSIRQLDPKIAASRNLKSFQYDIAIAEGIDFKTHEDKHKALASWGFTINEETKKVGDISDIFKFRNEFGKKRGKASYEVDGVVIFINDTALFEEAGVTGKAPRAGIAYKFSPREATTIVKNIKIQIGRTGVLTPVAELSPVEVGGVTISRATLHNEDEIKRLGVRVGDTVIIERAGDVIPKITKVLVELRPEGARAFVMPKKCPMDNFPVKKDGAITRCGNDRCGARHRETLYHFVSRGAFDIRGLGERVIDRFIDEGLISDAADIFSLTKGDVEVLERFGKKSAENIINEVNIKKNVRLEKFLFGIGILHIGEETAIDLARLVSEKFKNIHTPENVMSAFRSYGKEDLERIKDVGPKMAESIYDWFRKKENEDFMKRLDDVGVRITPPEKQQNILEGKTFVFTGTLTGFERNEAKERVRKLGGEVSESVSKKTDFVVAGENPGTKKSKAEKLRVRILSENEFVDVLKNGI